MSEGTTYIFYRQVTKKLTANLFIKNCHIIEQLHTLSLEDAISSCQKDKMTIVLWLIVTVIAKTDADEYCSS